jgi:Fic family protein
VEINGAQRLKWLLEQVVAACGESVGTVDRLLQKARFWVRPAHTAFDEGQRQALNALLDAAPDGFAGLMTNKNYAHLTHVWPATAQRDLTELTEREILRTHGAGGSMHYRLEA